jgi:predicted PhzF superfamily epimerase YddE/YHI9
LRGAKVTSNGRRDLQSVLVRLRTRIDEEHGIEAEIREPHQPRGGPRAHLERQRIGLKAHLPRLSLERRHPARVPVAQAGDGVATVKIENLAAVARMQPHPLAVRDLDRELRKDLREMVLRGGPSGGGPGGRTARACRDRAACARACRGCAVRACARSGSARAGRA